MAWNESTSNAFNMTCAPDAIWSAASAATSKYLGRKPDGSTRVHLSGGSVSEGSVKVKFLNKSFIVTGATNGTARSATLPYTGDPEKAKWYLGAYDNGEGDIVLSKVGAKVGTIDYETGMLAIDFGSEYLTGTAYGNRNNSELFDYTKGGSNNGYDSFDLDTAHVLVEWSSVQARTSVDGVYYLSDASGALKSGKTTFLCFEADEESSEFTPGKPFGVVRGVDVGWQGAKFTVEVSETCAISPRIDLWEDKSDRDAVYDTTIEIAVNDRLIRLFYTNHLQAAALEEAVSNRVDVMPPADVDKVRVRVVRYAIDNLFCYSAGVYESGLGMGFDQHVVMDKEFDRNGRDFLDEADFLSDVLFDIDWSVKPNSGLTGTDFKNGAIVTEDGEPLGDGDYGPKAAGCQVTNMTYLVVIGDGKKDFRGSSDTNHVRALSTVITRRFETKAQRTQPVVDDTHKTFYSAQPTFTWSMPGENAWAKKFGTTYTAFRLQIVDERDTDVVVYDSGIQRAPAQDLNGRFTWTAPVYAGCQTPQGKIFEANRTYKWHVTMYNAKFRSDYWSSVQKCELVFGEFTMDVNRQQEVNDHNYSSIGVSVKYTGSSEVLAKYADLSNLKGIIRVQAFTTADFSGLPVAETFATNEVTNVLNAFANAQLVGLPVGGTYYVRAYIDSNGNFKKDDWESWGAVETPVVLTVTDKSAPVVGLFIEDADTDQDWLPDALEYAWGGWTGSFDDIKNDNNCEIDENDQIAVTDRLKNALANKTLKAGLSTGLPGASLTAFQSRTYAEALMGIPLGNSSTFDAIRAAVKTTVEPGSFKITSLTMAENKIVLTMDADVSYEIAGQSFDALYDLSPYGEVKLNIYRKATLLDEKWTLAKEVSQTFTKGATEVEVDVSGIDFTSGFYKVEVVQ